MSLVIANVGGTLTGGTSKTLIPAGMSVAGKGAKSTYVAPGHTMIQPRHVDFFVTPPTSVKGDPGVARSAVKLSYASIADVESGCCDAKSGVNIIDFSYRYALSQPLAVNEEMLAMFRALVNAPEFETLVLQGLIPHG